MEGDYISIGASPATNQMMPLVAPNSAEMPLTHYLGYEITPVVKSHHTTHLQQQQQTFFEAGTTFTEIEEYFSAPMLTMQNIYSPSSTSNNSSVMFMDNPISPSSPINRMSPLQNQYHPMDPFAAMYSEMPIIPTDIGMYYNLIPFNDDISEHRRLLPRRHTVSSPYYIKDNNIATEVPQTSKSRKSSLKSKRHRSLGIDSPPVLYEKLGSWSCQQLLERIQQLEKEKGVVQTNKQDEEEKDIHACQWDSCSLGFHTLNELIFHVKTDHIGSGKANYFCCWKDCARNQKPFAKRHKMHNHLRTHTGEKPFVCNEPDCGKRFSRLDSLTTHSKIHSNIRPYLCSFGECKKAYYHLRSLRKHERTHTPQPSYSENQVFTDWELSGQTALLNSMNIN